MKLKTLESVFNCAIAGTNEPNHLKTLLKARDETVALANQCEDGFETEVTLVTTYAFSNLLNVSTYDDFGRLRKAFPKSDRILLRQYRNVVRDKICEEFTDAQIDDVSYFLLDLWAANEETGDHNPDGSFKRDDHSCDHLVARIAELETIINKLYHHRGLGPDDITSIERCIH